MKQISVRVDDELLEATDVARGEMPRERWIRLVMRLAAGLPVEGVGRAPAPAVADARAVALARQERMNADRAKRGRS